MEGSIITLVEPSNCQTSIRKVMSEDPRGPESTPIYYYCQIRRGDRTRFLERFSRKLNQNFGRTESTSIYYYCQIRRRDRTRFLERFLRKLNQGFGRTDVDSCAAFAAQYLKWHGLQYNSLPLLYNATLERQLR